MSDLLDRIRDKHLVLMRRTLATLGNILQSTPPDWMLAYTDGPDGWTAVEVLGHLLDADRVFMRRVECLAQENYIQLEEFPHEELLAEGDYRHQHPADIYAELTTSRQQFIALFQSLTPEQWEHVGEHPEY
ncbi:MAG TPA: DinB family protein, partial [Phototrophicaceae bacterium]|nr:DinB family protein [Phototrophicaceae bacterium]